MNQLSLFKVNIDHVSKRTSVENELNGLKKIVMLWIYLKKIKIINELRFCFYFELLV